MVSEVNLTSEGGRGDFNSNFHPFFGVFKRKLKKNDKNGRKFLLKSPLPPSLVKLPYEIILDNVQARHEDLNPSKV